MDMKGKVGAGEPRSCHRHGENRNEALKNKYELGIRKCEKKPLVQQLMLMAT